MAYKLRYSDYVATASASSPPAGESVPGGPSFIGNPQPPDVPCDPTGDAWRGPPGPIGPQGPPAAPGDLTGPLNIVSLPNAQPDGSPPVGAVTGDLYINGGFLCIAR
jgi:hypothetical protein